MAIDRPAHDPEPAPAMAPAPATAPQLDEALRAARDLRDLERDPISLGGRYPRLAREPVAPRPRPGRSARPDLLLLARDGVVRIG